MPTDWVSRVCAEALSWQGTPYVPKGRVKGVGVDCGALLYEVYNPVFGPFANFPTDYSADWAMHSDVERYLDFILPYVKRVPTIRPGCFTMLHVAKAYSHAAIMLENGNYIHAWGRLRSGCVMQNHPRIMNYLAKQSGKVAQHFEPR